MGVTEAPYSATGELLSYPEGVAEWRPINSFRASLTLVEHGRGRSAVTFRMQGADGRVWPMFVSDFVDLVRAVPLECGRTPEITWTVRKRGQNYGLRHVPQD